MNTNVPKIYRSKDSFVMGFSLPDVNVDAKFLEAIVDMDQDGELIGFEIISPIFLLGSKQVDSLRHFRKSADAGFYIAIDDEADALYVRFKRGRSMDQKAVACTVVPNANDEIAEIRLAIGSHNPQHEES
jgi:uncharacterized protein YuzE